MTADERRVAISQIGKVAPAVGPLLWAAYFEVVDRGDYSGNAFDAALGELLALIAELNHQKQRG